jgi:methyltransferase-like protein
VANLDPVSKQLVRILDGTRDHAALLKRLTELAEDCTLLVEQNGTRLTNPQQLTAALAEALEQSLKKLSGSALLVE